MAETISVPGVGPVKKPLLIGGLVVLGGILAVAWWRHSRNAGAAAGQAVQPDPEAIDPATGLTYGEEAAGIQSGTVAGYGTPYGDTSGIIGYDAQGNPVYADQVGYGPVPSFVSNGAWSQAAEQYLVASTGADAGVVAAALGTYLAGQPLTDAQASVVQQAIGFFGQPPQAGSNGYPPSLKRSGVPGGTGDGGGGTASHPITVTPAGLHVTNLYASSVRVAWSAPVIPSGQGPLTGYGCACYDSAGHLVNGPFKVPASQHFADFGKLKSRTRYHASIWCDPARTGGPHASVSFTTK
jgi:hypothetical protein